MSKKINEAFIQRWLSDELTSIEFEEFQKSSEYVLYKKILKVSGEFEKPEFNSEKVYKEINNYVENKKKPIKLNWKYFAAASILLLLGLWFFIDSTTKYSTGYGEKIVVLLPDSSEVYLNSKASIYFKTKKWKEDRVVVLKGEAFFKVKEGNKFKVITDLGSVSVLGTQFDVYTSNDYIEVKCFEGKVIVITENDENILTKGNASRSFKNGLTEKWDIFEIEPGWKNGESSFKSIALKYVINSIENQYGISIEADKIDLEQKFTGGYTHADLKLALKTVFEPMQIDVVFTSEKIVTLQKK